MLTRALAIVVAIGLVLGAAGACARLSGLAELARDDCAAGCDADVRLASDAADPRDALTSDDAGAADAVPSAAPRPADGVACGAERCPPRTACCLAPDGGTACDDGAGTCLRAGGFLVECDDDLDCLARSASSRCCGVYGAASDRYVSTSCVLTSACMAPLCERVDSDADADAGCGDAGACAAAAPSAPHVCR